MGIFSSVLRLGLLISFFIAQKGNGTPLDSLQETTTTKGSVQGDSEALPEEVLLQLLRITAARDDAEAEPANESAAAAAAAAAAATYEPVIQRLLKSLLEVAADKIQLQEEVAKLKDELMEEEATKIHKMQLQEEVARLKEELMKKEEEKEEEKRKCKEIHPYPLHHSQPPHHPLSHSSSGVLPVNLKEVLEPYHNSILRVVSDLRAEMISCERLQRDPEEQKEPWPSDCYDLFQNGIKKSGVYTIHPNMLIIPEGVKVWCDMGEGEAADEAEKETEDGGWTVIIKRQPLPDQVDFNRLWPDYKIGFGNPETEYYVGNDVLHAMTTGGKPQMLRADIVDWDNQTSFAIYNRFSVGDEASNYLLSVGDYSTLSSAGDSFGEHDGMKFTTPERDNDISDKVNCAKNAKGSFWFRKCWLVSPTSLLLPKDDDESTYGITWGQIEGKWINRRGISMKIHPRK